MRIGPHDYDYEITRHDFTGNEWNPGTGIGWCQPMQIGITCKVPAGEFSDCIKFGVGESYDYPDTYIQGEYLALNVGNVKFVRPGSDYYGLIEGQWITFELQSYTIVPYCGDANHPYPVGDLNHDCCVNLLDLAILASHWLERVNLEPVVYITEPEDGDVVKAYVDSVCITAEASDVDGSVVKVEFFIDGIKFAEENDEYIDGVAGWTACTSFDSGTYILTVKATDNDGATTTSPPVTITAVF